MRITHAIAAGVLALALTSCGSDGEGSSDSPEAMHNQADVEFAQQMIPHHQQAVEMSELAADSAGSPKVRALAEEIKAAQGPEIEKLTGWLQEWDEDVPSNMSGMDHDMEGMDHGTMSGMMSPQQMDKLAKLKGKQFDRAFLTMMIEHHQGAVDMAETEAEQGKYDAALEMAEQIEKTQRAEIKQMSSMLN